MRIKSIIAGLIAMIMGVATAIADNETPQSISGIATFNTGGVNLRMDPSAHAPYLCYLQGEEMYFNPENIVWSHELGRTRVGNEIIFVDHEKLQGEEGLTLPVLDTQDDWVKLRYLNHDVWTMKKFLNVKPVVAPTTSTTAGYSSYNQFNLTGDADGSLAIFFQEGGMDEDQGLLIGTKKGNTVVFDHFLPLMVVFDEKADNVQFSKDAATGYLTLTFGPAQQLASFTDYPVIDVKGFSAQNIKDMLPLAGKQDTMVFLTTGKDFLLIPN